MVPLTAGVNKVTESPGPAGCWRLGKARADKLRAATRLASWGPRALLPCGRAPWVPGASPRRFTFKCDASSKGAPSPRVLVTARLPSAALLYEEGLELPTEGVGEAMGGREGGPWCPACNTVPQPPRSLDLASLRPSAWPPTPLGPAAWRAPTSPARPACQPKDSSAVGVRGVGGVGVNQPPDSPSFLVPTGPRATPRVPS